MNMLPQYAPGRKIQLLQMGALTARRACCPALAAGTLNSFARLAGRERPDAFKTVETLICPE